MKRALGIVLAGLAGCAGVDPEPEWRAVQELARERGAEGVRWERDQGDALRTREDVRAMLADGLTRDEARRIAILNNRRLQAALEEIGIAKSELVEAGLLTNPRLDSIVRFPLDPGTLEANLFFFLSDLWIVPARREVALFRTQTRLARVGILIVEVGTEALLAYDDLLFRNAERDLLASTLKVNQDTEERMKVRYAAGQANDAEVLRATGTALDTRVELARAEREQKQSRARLDELLGLPDEFLGYTLSGSLEALPDGGWSADQATAFALERRLDLAASRSEIKALEARLTLERARVFPNVQVGGGFEGDLKGGNAGGPALRAELPIFDQNQGEISRAQYELRQAVKELGASELEARRDVTEVLADLEFHRFHAKLYQEAIEATRQKAVDYADRFTDLMQLNFLFLLDARRDQLESRRGYLRSLRGWRAAQARLQFVLWAGSAQIAPDPGRREEMRGTSRQPQEEERGGGGRGSSRGGQGQQR